MNVLLEKKRIVWEWYIFEPILSCKGPLNFTLI